MADSGTPAAKGETCLSLFLRSETWISTTKYQLNYQMNHS
jgi:hypothetical protein